MARVFRDASDQMRCHARVTLKDGTHAQCGRAFNWDYARNPLFGQRCCTQHAEMAARGRPVLSFYTGNRIRWPAEPPPSGGGSQ
jgi:hypothetical protein